LKNILKDKDVSLSLITMPFSETESVACLCLQGKVSAPRSLVGKLGQRIVHIFYANVLNLLAGLGAGVMESIFAVTPSETIK
jgi:hypothetical protein